jgi:hypothetical protein
MRPAKVTRAEEVIKQMEVTKKAKDTRAVRVINRFMTTIPEKRVTKGKRNMSRSPRRKGANTHLTMKRILMGRSMTRKKRAVMGRSTRSMTNTRRRDSPRYAKGGVHVRKGPYDQHYRQDTAISLKGGIKIQKYI